MDPIIPHREEREAHRQGTAARSRERNGAPPPALHWPVGVRGWLARLAVPGVLLVLIAVQYSVHSRAIDSLQGRIEALQAIDAAPSLPPPAASDTSEVSPLAEQLARHDELIRTLELRLATQIVELDSLRSTASDSFAQLSELTRLLDDAESDIKRQLAAQLATITSLQDDNNDLVEALADIAGEMARLRDEEPVPAVSSPAPADDARLNSFGARLDEAVTRIESQDVILNNWRLELEERLVATELRATQAPARKVADTTEIDHIRETLALLMKQHPFVKFPAD